jgi:hypothetical protein
MGAAAPYVAVTAGTLAANYLMQKKAPTSPTPATPPPATPMPTANDTNPQGTADARARKLSALKYGWQSTITKKPTLSSNPSGLKTTLGS